MAAPYCTVSVQLPAVWLLSGRASLDSTGEPPMTFLATPATEPVPVLRWIYANGGRRFFCELSLDEDHRVYELRTAAVGAEPHPRVERFADVTPAFLRQGQLEAELIRAGWSLEFYERLQPTFH